MVEEEARLRPLYARVLRLRHLNPGGLLCFVFLEGTAALGLLLALAELVSWWGILALPALVAVLVKLNDLVAGAAARSAALVPEQERDRFWREIMPPVGRATVPARLGTASGAGVGRPRDGLSGARAAALDSWRAAAGSGGGPASGDPAAQRLGHAWSWAQRPEQHGQLDRPGQPDRWRARQSGRRRYD